MKKWLWRLVDAAVCGAGLLGLYYIGGFWATLIGFGLIVWNFTDGIIRSNW